MCATFKVARHGFLLTWACVWRASQMVHCKMELSWRFHRGSATRELEIKMLISLLVGTISNSTFTVAPKSNLRAEICWILLQINCHVPGCINAEFCHFKITTITQTCWKIDCHMPELKRITGQAQSKSLQGTFNWISKVNEICYIWQQWKCKCTSIFLIFLHNTKYTM